MKRVLVVLFSLMTLVLVFAQDDVTTFLGIPVDGKESEFIGKIKKKGFKEKKFNDARFLTGRFNDKDVEIWIGSNNDKVCRVMVVDANPSDKNMIKIRYNNLCHQFKENDRYISDTDWTIPDNEDISYEMKENGKNYQAVFFQMPTELGNNIIYRRTLGEVILNSTPEFNELSKEERNKEIERIYLKNMSTICSNKRVWFTIQERDYNKFVITLFYDNDYNKSNGKDL